MEGKTSVREGVVKVELYRRIKPLMLFWITELWRTRKFAVPLILIGLAVFALKVSILLSALLLMLLVFLLRLFFMDLWNFGRKVRKFQRLTFPDLDLFVAPELENATDWQNLANQITEVQKELQNRFGFPLKHRLTVFIFPTMSEISSIFRGISAGVAMPYGDGVAFAWEVLKTTKVLQEPLRHELAHLFAYRLGKGQPVFKREGLSEWLQETEEGLPIDLQALSEILSGNELPLLHLFNDDYFRTSEPESYFFAGSFTGFLIERFGWDAYCRFYSASDSRNFEREFEKHFSMNLLTAEMLWKKTLLERRSSFEPKLSSLVRLKRVKAAYNSWNFVLCTEEAETLIREGEEDWKVIWTCAAAHTFLGNYKRAIELLQKLSSRQEDEWKPYRTKLWLQLGNLYDLIGEREKAIDAYKNSLKEPDLWDEKGSTHSLAARYLQQPFNEKELYQMLNERLMRK